MTIHFSNVTKSFGKKTALKNFSLQLEKNKIYGLLGRNGAGKTTMLKLVSGHIHPTSGQVLIDGKNPFNNRSLLEKICFIQETNNFKRRVKIKELLKIASLYYPNWSFETAERLLNIFRLDPNWSTKGLSKGMESALGIIIGLSSHAEITIFDEPYIGLDASLRYRFYDLLLEEFENKPRTIILSTHLIDEVSNLFEEIILMKDGELFAHKTTDEFLELSLKVEGKKESVDAFIQNKNVIMSKEIMGRKIAIVYGEKYNSKEAIDAGLQVDQCTIQELMVHLTEHRGSGAYV